jgi:hypothetical protein
MPLKQPLMPRDLVRNRPFIVFTTVATVALMVFCGFNVLWPAQISLYTSNNNVIGLISVRLLLLDAPPNEAYQPCSWLQCTTGTGVVLAEWIFGLLYKEIGHIRWQLLFGTIVVTTLTGVMALLDEHNLALGIAVLTSGSLVCGIR